MTKAIRDMERLNRSAAEIMVAVGVNACTDITGFGLLGHALEMAEASRVGLALDATALHVYPQVMELAALGLIPAGSYRNREYYLPKVVNRDQLPPEIVDIVADPQTSGGLLIAVPQKRRQELKNALLEAGCSAFEVGRVVAEHPGRMILGG